MYILRNNLVFKLFFDKSHMDDQMELRGDGKIPAISISAENLAEAAYKSIIACYDLGARVETPKHQRGMTLGCDADITVRVENPDSEPKILIPAVYDDGRGLMQYILEVTHGIHNHWKKDEQHPDRWGYTYNERIVDQLPFIFQRIKADWDKKRKITGRDYQFTTWRAGEDIVLEQEDPPCWQRGQLRFLENSNGELVINYQTDWRSRDLAKAWNENNLAQIELMKLLRNKISAMISRPIKLGAYIDHSSSLHLYGLYFEKDHLAEQIESIRAKDYKDISWGLENALAPGAKKLKKLISAQSDAERKGEGFNLSETGLRELGYDTDNFPYPSEWDSWPKSWDAEPDVTKLARVFV